MRSRAASSSEFEAYPSRSGVKNDGSRHIYIRSRTFTYMNIHEHTFTYIYC